MRSLLLVAGAATLLLAGCDFVPTNTNTTAPASGTMALLRAGNAAICVDSDVEETLRSLIRPDGVANDRFDIAFSAASLESFQANVSKATCNAAVRVTSRHGGEIANTTLDFVVKPAAQNTGSFVISAPIGFLKAQLGDTMASEDEEIRDHEQEAAARQALLDMVKPRWVTGRWVLAGSGAEVCADGPAFDIQPGHRFSLGRNEGTWQLTGQVLTLSIGDQQSVFTITDADTDGFGASDAQGSSSFYRRCSKDEAPPPAPTPPPSPSYDRAQEPSSFQDPSQ